jgi:hypothetical protein
LLEPFFEKDFKVNSFEEVDKKAFDFDSNISVLELSSQKTVPATVETKDYILLSN